MNVLLRSAEISACERYRWSLARGWSTEFGSYILWIMLNPSTADATTDDATIENICQRSIDYCLPWFARSHCARKQLPVPVNLFTLETVGLIVGNLYAWRDTDPFQMWAAHVAGEDIIGPENDRNLQQMIGFASAVICAWGNGTPQLQREQFHRRRASAVYSMIRDAGKPAWMLELCKSGHPRHPLYFPMHSQPVPFTGYTQGKEDGDQSAAPEAAGENSR